jgi:hypothetical protein
MFMEHKDSYVDNIGNGKPDVVMLQNLLIMMAHTYLSLS